MKKLIIILFSTMLFSCSTVLLTGRKQYTVIPTSQMLSLSNDSYQQVLTKNELSNNAQYKSMVNDVGNKISYAVEEYMIEHGQEERIKNYTII